MGLEGIVQGERSQTEKVKYHIISLIYVIEKRKQNRNSLSDAENELMVATGMQGGGRGVKNVKG